MGKNRQIEQLIKDEIEFARTQLDRMPRQAPMLGMSEKNLNGGLNFWEGYATGLLNLLETLENERRYKPSEFTQAQ